MLKNFRKIILAFVILSGVFISNAPAFSCSLAYHDWQLMYFVKIPINAPLVPLAEIDSISLKFKNPITNKILWAVKPGLFTPYLNFILTFFDSWVAKADWYVASDNVSALKLAKQFSENDDDEKPVIVKSDKNFLKLAVFFDANSKNNCCQIVLAQESRVRCLYQDYAMPWAQEYNIQSWYSLIFYHIPLPGNIISFSAYPVEGNRLSIYEDHPLVEELLSKKILMRRPDLVVDPYAFDFPDLPNE